MGKLKGTWFKGRNSTVKSSKLSWTGQYKKCVQYDFKFTSVKINAVINENRPKAIDS